MHIIIHKVDVYQDSDIDEIMDPVLPCKGEISKVSVMGLMEFHTVQTRKGKSLAVCSHNGRLVIEEESRRKLSDKEANELFLSFQDTSK